MRKKIFKQITLIFAVAIIASGCSKIQKASVSTASSQEVQSQSIEDFTYPGGNFDGSPYVVVNNNEPFFSEIKAGDWEVYPELDELGRCGAAYACISKKTMPTQERGKIGNIKPSGWNQAKYPEQVGENPGYLYNRCHLIAYCLAGENDNEKNLITGTRYLNTKGMLPFEEKVAKYLDKNPKNHVVYRVTPIFDGDNLLATGVLMEAASVEDKQIRFCVYCYNVQPGIEIDYATGKSRIKE